MVKAVTTRSGMRKTPIIKETKKQPPLETNLNKDETPRTAVSKETTNNSCEDNPKDKSIKEMQSTDPFCKCIVKRLLNKTAPKLELKTFFIYNGLLYRYASDHSKDFCALVIPKAWRYTILVETHDKMGHQGNNRTYSLIKRQYYWKGMAKDVKDYIHWCPVCWQEKARVQSYPLHMMEIPDWPFDKIAMDLVTDFTESNKGNKHILTIIDLLTGWPEAIPIPNKSANTITKHSSDTTYPDTCAPGSYYQTMAQSSRIRSLTKSRKILASRGYSLHHTTHKATGN